MQRMVRPHGSCWRADLFDEMGPNPATRAERNPPSPRGECVLQVHEAREDECDGEGREAESQDHAPAVAASAHVLNGRIEELAHGLVSFWSVARGKRNGARAERILRTCAEAATA